MSAPKTSARLPGAKDPRLESWLRRASHDLRGNVATIEFALQGMKRFSGDAGTGLPQAEVLEILRRRTQVLKGDLDHVFLFLRLVLLEREAAAADVAVDQVIRAAIEELPENQRGRIQYLPAEPMRQLVPGFLAGSALRPVLKNAVLYGTGPVSVVCTEMNGGLALDVSNRGNGIPQDERGVLFEPFVRGANSRGIPGLGLGLAIARLSVQASGGSLDLVAWNPEDTRFRLFMPLTTRSS